MNPRERRRVLGIKKSNRQNQPPKHDGHGAKPSDGKDVRLALDWLTGRPVAETLGKIECNRAVQEITDHTWTDKAQQDVELVRNGVD